MQSLMREHKERLTMINDHLATIENLKSSTNEEIEKAKENVTQELNRSWEEKYNQLLEGYEVSPLCFSAKL